MENHENTFSRIYEVVRQIPKGRVASYGQVAALAGNRRWSRVVGFALHVNPDPDGIPCYRVVTKDGRVSEAFAFGGGNRQVELLKADGVEFVDGHVDMKKYQWETPWINICNKVTERFDNNGKREHERKYYINSEYSTNRNDGGTDGSDFADFHSDADRCSGNTADFWPCIHWNDARVEKRVFRDSDLYPDRRGRSTGLL